MAGYENVRSNKKMKNKYLIASNIEEAKEQLEEILKDIEEDKEYSEVELQIALEHAYHHLNYAWNIRNIEEARAEACSKSDYKAWSKYPANAITEYE